MAPGECSLGTNKLIVIIYCPSFSQPGEDRGIDSPMLALLCGKDLQGPKTIEPHPFLSQPKASKSQTRHKGNYQHKHYLSLALRHTSSNSGSGIPGGFVLL